MGVLDLVAAGLCGNKLTAMLPIKAPTGAIVVAGGVADFVVRIGPLSGQDIAVLPGWGERTYFGDCCLSDCCGHPLTLSWKKLKDREVDIYLCTHHNRRPDECPKTHIIYHEVLYPYILEQIRALVRRMKRRKVNSPICRYVDIQDLTPEILRETVERIEIEHIASIWNIRRSIKVSWNL